MFRRRRTFEHAGRTYRLAPGVFDPVRHLSGVAFADTLPELVPAGARVLDLGTGCGLLAAVAATAGARVIATDHDERAVRCAEHNVEGLDVETRLGDLFDPVRGERFDLVVVNPPYEVGPSRAGRLRSPDFLRRFGAEVDRHAPATLIGFPADEADRLAAELGRPVTMRERIPTSGLALGVFSC